MRQFHLSLQSGSEAVLKRMHRRYTPGEYLRAVETLREYMPDCAVTTDIIVGFPGETEQEFSETLAFAEEAKLARIHVFPYSRRSGTVADKLPGQVDEAVKKERARRLIELGSRLERRFVSSLLGTVQPVLFEEEGEDGACEGYTGQYVRVRAANVRPGQLAEVRLTGADGALAHGEVINILEG
jgi:threonylcarbamoyladenosine tRNA methylthiotransferase MtaB